MNKQDNISTRVEMIRVSFLNNSPEQSKKVIAEWSIRDLYDILGHSEVSDMLGMEEGKLTSEHIGAILEVLNEKAQNHKDAIWSLVCTLNPEPREGHEEINQAHIVRLIHKLLKDFPMSALKEIRKQDEEWKEFFKSQWPELKKKYIG